MALQKQKVDLVFSEGLKNKIDSKLTLGASLRTLENAVFTKQGVLNKRFGNTALSPMNLDGTTITDMKACLKYNETELLLAANETLYSYSDNLDGWVDKGSLVSSSVKSKDIVFNSAEQTSFTQCYKDGISMFAWEDSRGGIRYSVRDDSTGALFVNDAVLDASGDTPQCIALGTSLMCFYGNSTNLKYAYVSIGNPTGTPTSGNTRTDLHADHLFDVVNIGNKAYIFYKHTTATTGALCEVSTTGGISNSTTFTATIADTCSLSTYNSSNVDYLNLVYKEDTDTVRCAIYTSSFIEIVAVKDLDATTGTDIEKITSIRTNSTTDQVTIYYQVPATSDSDDYIVSNTLDLDGTVGTRAVFKRSVGLATKAFSYGGSNYVGTLHQSDLQSTIFVLNSDGYVVVKFAPGNSGTHAGVGAFLSPVISKSTGAVSFVMNAKGTIRSENATLFSLLGGREATIDFEGSNTYSSANLNRNLGISGGILNSYDGQSVVEQGFHLFPEGDSVTATSASGGYMSDGTRQYCSLYKWVDAAGNIHRSAPSIAYSNTLSGGGSTQKNTVTIPTLRLTRKTTPRVDVTIEVYRTEAAGTIFYNVGSVASPTDNDPTADSVTFDDTLADSSIISNEILYTTGGVLDNIAAPSCDILITHQNRLFIAGLQNKNEIRYTKIVRNGEAPAFNEALSISVDPKGGAITGLASMDSNLIIFKRDNIYRVSGDGPSDTGTGATFTEPELVSTDVGCISTNSIVSGPEGLYFKSAKGIYLLSRSLQVSYVGSGVEDFNNNTIVSAELLDDVNEVRFYTSSEYTLVYNYYFGQWSVFTGQSSADSVVWNNQLVWVSSSSGVFKEDSSTYLDGGAGVSMKIATGWVRVGHLQGFQRAYRVALLGEYLSRHTLRISTYNDYSTTQVQQTEFATQDIISTDSGYYGDGVYGAESSYGSNDNGVYQFSVHLKKQKCQAVRFVIEDVFDNSLDNGTGAAFSLSGLTIEVGVKRGINKTPTTRQG